ncbi:monocarboxylate transporter 1-like isoform X2 [Crocuta crocuta]
MFAVMYAGGPISSILVNKYGSRPTMIAGGCLSGCGLIAASFSNTVQELYLYIGFIGGLGLAFNLNPALTMIGHLNDTYGDYKYTYWACGVILIIAGIYLFIGMGINYRLVAEEQKAEKQQRKEGKEKPKEVIKAADSRG